MAIKTVFVTRKGGTGKTTLSTTTAYILAVSGKRVLYVEVDGTGNGADTLLRKKIENEEIILTHENTIYNTIVNGDPLPILNTSNPNLDVVGVTPDLDEAELKLLMKVSDEGNYIFRRLKRAFTEVEDKYDHIIIDVSPHLGVLTLNALAAANDIVIVTSPGRYETMALKGFINSLESVKEKYNSLLKIRKIVMNKVEGVGVKREEGFKATKDTLNTLKDDESISKYLCTVLVRKSSDVQNAQDKGLLVVQDSRYSPASKDIVAFVNETFL